MPFIKTKCVLENKTHKAPRLILFLQIRKKLDPPPKKKKDILGQDGAQKDKEGQDISKGG